MGPLRHPDSRRFAIATTVLFRQAEQAEWRRGNTVEISGDRVVFLADSSIAEGTSLRLVVCLGEHAGDTSIADVYCTGRVVACRNVEGTRALVTAHIEGHAFLRPDADDCGDQ